MANIDKAAPTLQKKKLDANLPRLRRELHRPLVGASSLSRPGNR